LNLQVIAADLIAATAVIGRLAAASTGQKCEVIEAIAAAGVPVDKMTVGQLMEVTAQVLPVRSGTASTVPSCTEPQRREVRRLLEAAGIDATTVHAGLADFMAQARIQMPHGIPLAQALRGISYPGAARLIQAIRRATATEEATA